MPEYMLSVHTGADTPGPGSMSEERMAEMMARIGALEADMRAEDALALSARLFPPDTATVVRSARGEVVTTDGPYAEAKEHIAGFYLIRVADLDAALRWAARTSECIRMPIEVRPFTTDPHS